MPSLALTLPSTQLRFEGISKNFSASGDFFSRPVDALFWEVVTADARQYSKGNPVDALSVVDKFAEIAVQMSFNFYSSRQTGKLGLRLTADEYVEISLDMQKVHLKFELATFSKAKTEDLFKMITNGLGLIRFELPNDHLYLSSLLKAS